jgi:hypothetical protein
MRNIRNIAISLIAIITLTPSSASAERSEYREPSLPATDNTWSTQTIAIAPPRAYWEDVAKCQAQVNKKVRKKDADSQIGKYLAIPYKHWNRYGGTSFAPHPNLATRSQQIIVANRIAVLGWTTTNELGDSKRIRPKGFKFTSCALKTVKTLKNYQKRVRLSLPNSPEKYCSKWEPVFEQQGLPVKLFSYIAWRESRCQTQAVGWNYHKGRSHRDCKLSQYSVYKKCSAIKSHDIGLLQINSSWKTLTSQVCNSQFGDLTVLKDPSCNIKVAKHLYENTSNGLGNWSIKVYSA